MILPTDRPQAITPIIRAFIPLYPVPPIPSPKRRNGSELSDGLLSDGFPPIKICRDDAKTGLGRKNLLNSSDLTRKEPARNVKVRFRALDSW